MDKTKKTLDMVRSGEFSIKTYGKNHCGTSHSFNIRYHLKCSCSSKLDHRGFLFDQLNIQSFFESIGRTQLSCERLTQVCQQQLLEHILLENPTCQIYRIELTLAPEPFLASMTSAWDNPNDPLTRPIVKKSVIKSKKNKTESVLLHSHEPSHDHYLFREQE